MWMNSFVNKVDGYKSITSLKTHPNIGILHRLFQKFEVTVSIDSQFEV